MSKSETATFIVGRQNKINAVLIDNLDNAIFLSVPVIMTYADCGKYIASKQMGILISHIMNKYWGKKQIRILMVGLDGAGKTTILYKFKLGEAVRTIPTVGFNVETVDYKNTNFTVWDVGGQDKLRRLWRHYYQNTDGLIFVIDSSDRDRIEEATAELKMLLIECELQNAVLLVFANKQDMPVAMTPSELAHKLSLHEIRDRKWHIQGVCALRGTGLYDGFDWLYSEVQNSLL